MSQNHNSIEFLSNTGPDPLEKHEATQRAFNVGPLSARQQNANKYRFASEMMMVHFSAIWILSPPLIKKRCQSWTPSDKTLWFRVCVV